MTIQPKVLFVNHTSTISGAEKVLLNIVAGCAESSVFLFERGALNDKMAANGRTVTASRTDGRLSALTRSASPRVALPLAGKLSLLLAELVKAALRHDVIYANSQKAFSLSAVAAAMMRKPLIWHLHDIMTPEHFGGSQRRLQVTLANRYCRAVVGPSQAVADAFIAAGGNPKLCHVVANGVSVSADSRPRHELRKALELPEGPLIGVFSRLAPWKGQHVVVRALAELPDVKCIVAGSALFNEHAYVESLHALVNELHLADRVTFLGQRDDVGSLMQAVDIVVHPSVSPEPFALTLLEAMQLRTPVIAAANGGSCVALEDGRAGTLVPTGDAAALAAAVRSVMRDPARAEQIVSHAEVRAKNCFGVARMQQEIAAVIESAALGPRAC